MWEPGLPAMTDCQSMYSSPDTPPSRASPLPHFCFVSVGGVGQGLGSRYVIGLELRRFDPR